MNRKLHIQKTGAIFLLFVFILAATPKLYLHNIVTDHAHTSVNYKHGTLVSAKGYNCQLDDLVVSSNFLNDFSFVNINNSPQLKSFDETVAGSNYTSTFYHFTLRGPPAFI